MDKLDEQLNEAFKNNNTICNPELLNRLAEGYQMIKKCMECQTKKHTHEIKIPSEVNDIECSKCECQIWFYEHGTKLCMKE